MDQETCDREQHGKAAGIQRNAEGDERSFSLSSCATYNANRLSSVRSAFFRLLLGALAGAEGSPLGGDGNAESAALARSSKNLSNSKRKVKNK